MRKFQFPLESALRWRRQQQEAEEQKAAWLAAERRRAVQTLEATVALWVSAREQAQEELDLRGGDLQILSQYGRALDRRRRQIEDQIARLDRALATQRAAVLEAQRRTRLLEKLRESRFQEWGRELDGEIERLATETYLARWDPGSERR